MHESNKLCLLQTGKKQFDQCHWRNLPRVLDEQN